MITFTVPGNPVPWQRAQSRGGQRFTAPRTRAYQDLIRDHARLCAPSPITGPVRLTLRFYRDSAQACDLDNLTKTVGDALNGIAYADDRQIVDIRATKTVDRELPRVEVEIEALGEKPLTPADLLDMARSMEAGKDRSSLWVERNPAAASNTLEGLKRLGTPKRRPRLTSSRRDFRDVAKGGRS